AAEAKRRIQAHQRESAAALCAERDAIQTRFDLSRAFLELASANALMESTLVWELLGRLGDDAARDLVTQVHEARMRGDTPVALSGDLPLFFLLQGQDVR